MLIDSVPIAVPHRSPSIQRYQPSFFFKACQYKTGNFQVNRISRLIPWRLPRPDLTILPIMPGLFMVQNWPSVVRFPMKVLAPIKAINVDLHAEINPGWLYFHVGQKDGIRPIKFQPALRAILFSAHFPCSTILPTFPSFLKPMYTRDKLLTMANRPPPWRCGRKPEQRGSQRE